MRDPFHHITFRIFFLGAVQVFFVVLLCIPLYMLQILHRGRYETLSTSNRIVTRPILAPRGELYDRYGEKLAFNKGCFHLVGTPQNERVFWRTLEEVNRVVDISQYNRKRLTRSLRIRQSRFEPVIVKRNLSWEEVARFQLRAQEFESFSVVPGFARCYPLKDQCTHFLGYIAPPTEKEAALYNLPRTMQVQVGKQGIEKLLEPILGGKPGVEIIEVDASQRKKRLVENRSPEPGKDIFLSIDATLQCFVAQRLKKEKSAVVMVMDIQSGDILAHVSHPSFDPHLFREGISTRDWNSLRDNAYKPLVDKGLQGLYAPGSTVKSLFILAGLEAGVLTPRTSFFCDGLLFVKRHPFHCWMHKYGGHGLCNAHQAVMRSCDVFMYQLGLRLGVERMKAVMNTLGFGQVCLEGFVGARKGLVPDPLWKRTFKGASWTKGDSVLMSIGQGYSLATPLELVTMMARLASGLKVMPSYLRTQEAPQFERMHFPRKNLVYVRKGLIDTVNAPRGTAFRWRIQNPLYAMAGKTGTSQVKSISLSERFHGVKKNEERLWKERDHALFVGYAPYKNPRYAICVVVEHGGFGASRATPIARDVLFFAQSRKVNNIKKST